MVTSAVSVSDLGKWYVVNENRFRRTLTDKLGRMLSTPFRATSNDISPKEIPNAIWALRNISFEVESGKVMGVIGRNGSGKSTLLRILARITTPTEGRATLRGRVGALLEVGTGFHPDLSGRENIMLSGTMIGMTPTEVRRREEAIVDFSEVGEFIDTPVKHYSSGMFMRLAFSVAAHLDTEIVLVDEVLAVGDEAFQRKCKTKIRETAMAGRTVLFTSHDMESVRTICQSCLLLDHGKMIRQGDVQPCIEAYQDLCNDIRFSGDSSKISFVLSRFVAHPADIDVYVGNVRQEPHAAYTVSSTTLTFAAAPISGTHNIYVVYKK